MATALEDFPTWLSGKLQELKTDEDIFGSYIMGILDSDETAKEKSEALQGILSEIVENRKTKAVERREERKAQDCKGRA
ncbi:unnamed protein product [Acanthoscelides obtectus]|uniref:Coiled-coil domain-containing protein 43 n=1 Tax=Acanthoscelides obtectus TaxID=200917 RepID=A0A9P0PDJ2_ACAOB|nr:unnamed protein product [Acanthoscelides obtectus]CAK1641856.1 Coiled-coil domain-containing protein 43 [Acanthoscelides obtectus]